MKTSKQIIETIKRSNEKLLLLRNKQYKQELKKIKKELKNYDNFRPTN